MENNTKYSEIAPYFPAPRTAEVRLLLGIRLFGIAVQVIAFLLVTFTLQIPLPLLILAGIFTLQLAITGLLTFRLRRMVTLSHKEILANLLADILLLSAVLYHTGGSANPFATLYLLPIMVAATLLGARAAWLLAVVSTAAYAALMVWNQPIAYFHHHHLGEYFSIHQHGMWLSFVLVACLVAWYVSRLARVMRQQEKQLARGETLAAYGAFAASAAHELGTPIATALLLAEEIRPPSAEAKASSLTLLEEQLLRARQILSRMALEAGQFKAASGQRYRIDALMEEIFTQWKHEIPASLTTSFCFQGAGETTIVADYALKQAIRHLLDNASDAATTTVTVSASCREVMLQLQIQDDGPGIPDAILRNIANSPERQTMETNDLARKGLGMGLSLTRLVVERLGGSLHYEKPSPGGTLALLSLPLAELTV
jgi:two-component system sensor histidine kinase RegB